MKNLSPALAAATLLCAYSSASFAQSAAVSCPAAIDISYTGVGQLDFGPIDAAEQKKLDIKGFHARFEPARIRLIEAGITPGPDEKNELSSGTADNEMDAKPGQALIYTIWPQGEKQPEATSFITCKYEGGYAIVRKLPMATRQCTSQQTWKDSARTEISTRRTLTRASFNCK